MLPVLLHDHLNLLFPIHLARVYACCQMHNGGAQRATASASRIAKEGTMRPTKSSSPRSLLGGVPVLVLCLGAFLLSSGEYRQHRRPNAAYADDSGFVATRTEMGDTQIGGQKSEAKLGGDNLPLSPPPGIRSFTGRVVKVAHRYLFKDALLGTTYEVDPQPAVRAFEGMTVRLNGALDSRGKTIHLQHPSRY